MLYKEIAQEILEDEELQKKHNLSSKASLSDDDLIIQALNIIIQEKENNRSEKRTNTSKATRELNRLFSII